MSDSLSLALNDERVQHLADAVNDAQHGWRQVPNSLFVTLRDKCWKERVHRRTGEVIRHATFEAFVVTPPWHGLGSDLETLRRLCGDDQSALDLLDKEVQRPAGNPTGANQHTGGIGLNQSNSRDRRGEIPRRLRKDFGAEHAAVMEGRVSLTAAAVRAGVYPRRISINLENAASAAQSIRAHATPAYVATLLAALLAEESAP